MFYHGCAAIGQRLACFSPRLFFPSFFLSLLTFFFTPLSLTSLFFPFFSDSATLPGAPGLMFLPLGDAGQAASCVHASYFFPPAESGLVLKSNWCSQGIPPPPPAAASRKTKGNVTSCKCHHLLIFQKLCKPPKILLLFFCLCWRCSRIISRWKRHTGFGFSDVRVSRLLIGCEVANAAVAVFINTAVFW